MLKHVLIPLDGSQLAEIAVDVVKNIMPPGGKVTLVTAVPSGAAEPDVTLPTGDAIPLETYLHQAASRLRLDGYEAGVEIREGEAGEVIDHLAVTLGVDMIAMSSSGRAGLERLLFGSTTDAVLTEAPCPVLVIPNRVRQRAPEPAPNTDSAPDVSPGLAT